MRPFVQVKENVAPHNQRVSIEHTRETKYAASTRTCSHLTGLRDDGEQGRIVPGPKQNIFFHGCRRDPSFLRCIKDAVAKGVDLSFISPIMNRVSQGRAWGVSVGREERQQQNKSA